MEFSDKVTSELDYGQGVTYKVPADGKVEEIGNVMSNKISILRPGKSATYNTEEVTESSLQRTGPHEIGHTGGLRHQKSSDKNNPINIGSNNLMYVRGQNGKDFTLDQLRILEENLPEKND